MINVLVSAFLRFLRPLKAQGRLTIAAMVFLASVAAGPFDTLTRISLGERFVYWAGIVITALVTARLVRMLFRSVAAGKPQWQMSLMYSATMTLVFTPFVYGWTHLHVPPRGDSLMGYHWFAIYVALISMIIFHAHGLVGRTRRSNDFRHSEAGTLPFITQEDKDVVPRLLRRINADDPGPIIRIEAMDHFVTVVTMQDQYILRLRFADAVDEMDGVKGLTTHRSHWVALAGVIGHKREKGRLFLHMSCNTYVPVSRKYFPDVTARILNASTSTGHRNRQGPLADQNSDSIGAQ
ncbi:LytTR family transcriptional regulator [Seohaeicola saemankumensis]|uniref:LytTR family DNA-binding domain-containing protein n=1 Tax=Seohaeicola saemankumensis TaxID=481181 RepID=UPI001E56353E|nr:LytTR family DNA-binding domain-containing protein [Seohaeicola saemankumensis]MCD1625934.1 LytTR family transcriptional regulator [Seohaeicola saemankumensis]